MAKKVTNEDIRQRLYNKVGNEYTLESDYRGGNKKVDLYHTKCGGIYQVTPNHFFYDGTRCKCQWNIKQPEDFKKDFDSISQGEYTLLDKYYRKDVKVKIRHEECGNVFYATPHSFLQGKGCPECFGNKRKTTQEFKKEVKHLGENEFVLLTDYYNNRVKVEMKHIECGNTFYITPKDFLRGNRCPYCKQSKGERLIRVLLENRNEYYEQEKCFEDLKSGSKYMPFDFYIPRRNLLIEYDGMQHYKSSGYFGGHKKLESQRRRDKIKNTYVNRHSIRLLRIPYTYSKEEVKEVLYSYLT